MSTAKLGTASLSEKSVDTGVPEGYLLVPKLLVLEIGLPLGPYGKSSREMLNIVGLWAFIVVFCYTTVCRSTGPFHPSSANIPLDGLYRLWDRFLDRLHSPFFGFLLTVYRFTEA